MRAQLPERQLPQQPGLHERKSRRIFTAPATSQVAYLNISVPADAKLYLQDQLMTVEGAQRRFVTPVIAAGETHLYTVKVEIVRDGKTLTKTAQTTVIPGQEAFVAVAFDAQVASN